MTDATDEQLVKRSLGGNKAAFGLLILRHQEGIRALAQRYLGNHADAEDLSQEAFIEAYVNLDTLQEHGKFGSWLRSITRHLCVAWLRRRTRSVSYEEFVHNGHFETQYIEASYSTKSDPRPDESLGQEV